MTDLIERFFRINPSPFTKLKGYGLFKKYISRCYKYLQNGFSMRIRANTEEFKTFFFSIFPTGITNFFPPRTL